MTSSIKVIPAVLTDNPEKLTQMAQQSAAFTDYVQIDFMDGKFVPSMSIKPEQITGIPQNLEWEAHIMIEKPINFLESYKKAGAKKVIFHFEATPSPVMVISEARRLGLSVGLAVNPDTSNGEVLPYLAEIDSLLYMSVYPGFYGAKFIPEVLKKVKQMRRANPELIIGLDGGVKENNIAEIAQSGVDEIFVGSAIFMQPDMAAAYRKLVTLAHTAC